MNRTARANLKFFQGGEPAFPRRRGSCWYGHRSREYPCKGVAARVPIHSLFFTFYPKVGECLSSKLAKEPDFSVLVIGYSLGNIVNLSHLTFYLHPLTIMISYTRTKELALPSWSQRDCLKAQKLRFLMADRSDDMKSNVR